MMTHKDEPPSLTIEIPLLLYRCQDNFFFNLHQELCQTARNDGLPVSGCAVLSTRR